jgi:hypothetical protein
VREGRGGREEDREVALRLRMAGSKPWYSIMTCETDRARDRRTDRGSEQRERGRLTIALPGTACRMFIHTWKMLGVIFWKFERVVKRNLARLKSTLGWRGDREAGRGSQGGVAAGEAVTLSKLLSSL